MITAGVGPIHLREILLGDFPEPLGLSVNVLSFVIAGKRSHGVKNDARDNVFDCMVRLHNFRKRIGRAAQDLKLSCRNFG